MLDPEVQLGLYLNLQRSVIRRSAAITAGISASMATEGLDETYFEAFTATKDQARLAAHRSRSKTNG